MLKVVVDTNNFVSSLINKKGPSAKLIELWRHSYFIILMSRSMIDEIRRVLTYPRLAKKYQLKSDDIEIFINLLEHEAIVLEALPDVKVIADDPDDNKFLACALAAKADYIVSGDRHLLDLGNYQGIAIIPVQEFLKLSVKRN